MRFCVTTTVTSDGESAIEGRYFEGSYKILDSGVLVVTDGEDVITYSPHFWVSVEHPQIEPHAWVISSGPTPL